MNYSLIQYCKEFLAKTSWQFLLTNKTMKGMRSLRLQMKKSYFEERLNGAQHEDLVQYCKEFLVKTFPSIAKQPH